MNTTINYPANVMSNLMPNRVLIGSSMIPGMIKNMRLFYLSMLVLYLIVLILLYVYNPWNIVTDYFDYSLVISIIFLAYYSQEFSSEDEMKIYTGRKFNIIELFVRMAIVIAGLGISAGFMYWIVKSFGEINNADDYVKIILNIIVLALIFTIVYRFFNVSNFISNIPIVRMIVNTLLYIPCLISDSLDFIIGKSKSKDILDLSYIYLLFAIMFVYFIYFFAYPYYVKNNKLQGGKLLLNKPEPLNIGKNIMSYREINEMSDSEEGYDYQYGLSMWFYVDAEPVSTNTSYSRYTSIVN